MSTDLVDEEGRELHEDPFNPGHYVPDITKPPRPAATQPDSPRGEVKSRPYQDQPVLCERCQGNGEIVTDWGRYLGPPDGDDDEAVATCEDCDGTGRTGGKATERSDG